MRKVSPWAQVLVQPLEGTPKTVRRSYSRIDWLAEIPRERAQELVFPDRYVDGVRLTTPEQAVGTSGFLYGIDNLQWWDLVDSEIGSSVSGFTVAPFVCPRNNQVRWHPLHLSAEESQQGTQYCYGIIGDTDYYCIEWEVDPIGPSGGRYWQECLPDADPTVTALTWVCSERDSPFSIHTYRDLPPNQSWALRLWWQGTAPSDEDEDPAQAPHLDVVWGGGAFVLRFSLLSPPQLIRCEGSRARVVRTAEDFALDPFELGEPVWVKTYYLAGRLVIDLEPEGGDRTRIVYTHTIPNAETGTPEFQPLYVDAAPLALTGDGVVFSAALCEVKWGRWVPERVDEFGVVTPGHFDGTGRFVRRYRSSAPRSARVSAAALGFWGDGSPARRQGWADGDPASLGTVSDYPVATGGHYVGEREYVCTVRAHNPDLQPEDVRPTYVIGPPLMAYTPTCMCGASTPFIHSVVVRAESAWRREDATPLDLTPAVLGMSEDTADPMLQAGANWTIQIDRFLLPSCTVDGEPVGEEWVRYLRRYHTIDVRVAWTYSDGVVRAICPELSLNLDYCTRLHGVITSLDCDTSEWSQRRGTVHARDLSFLLQAPAGVVDSRFAPLDFLLYEKAREGVRGDLYGWEAVAYILRVALGDYWANNLVPVFPSNHYSLLTWEVLIGGAHGSFLFPPPFGRDAYQWIRDLATHDFAVFFFGPDAAHENIVPIYGNYYKIVAQCPEVELPDTNYKVGDLDRVLGGVAFSQTPSRDYNRVLVWGRPPGGDSLGGLMPALPMFSAEARIEEGSPIAEQNISDTWERTLLLHGNQFWLLPVARVVAVNLARLIRGVDTRGITLRTRGNPFIYWGWKVRPRLDSDSSDASLGLDGKLCRVVRVRNDYDLQRNRWDTVLRVAEEPEV